MKYTINNKIFGLGMAVMLIFSVFTIIPAKAEAGSLLDPFCLWSGCGDSGGNKTVNKTYNNTNSYNKNSNINSPGAVVNTGTSVGTPVYAYDNYSYNNYPYSQLKATCYAMPPSARAGTSVLWASSVYGGNGSYHITWTGTDGLSGSGSSITKTYYRDGIKSATIKVISGNQTVSRNCDTDVEIYGGDDYNDDYYYDYDNYDYGPLSVYCSADRTYSDTDESVRWTAYATGGDGSYRYSWDGTDNLSGSSKSVYKTYRDNGYKYASVTVRSDGRSITRSCNNGVNVGDYRYNNNVYYNTGYIVNNQNTLDIGCFADPSTIRVNQATTWSAEVTGGIAPYSYSWTGTDGLSGNQASLIKYYSTTGEKNAIVTITSADGKTGSRTCTNVVTVRSASSGTTNGGTQNINKNTDDNSLSASALFSLKNVPWGWVAILVILVLFATVMYLLFNRTKI